VKKYKKLNPDTESLRIKPSICFIVTSPFTVNGFLINHLTELAKLYEVTLCTNVDQYYLSPKLGISNLNIINVPLSRKISLWIDLKSWWILFCVFRKYHFDSVHSITPKAGLLGMSAAFFARTPFRLHTFTGQIWSNKAGMHRFFFKYVDWVIAKLATFVFADSSSQIEFLLQEGICNSSKIAMLGEGSISGVDLNRFHVNALVKANMRQELLARESDCIFLYVGRLCRDKGLFDLLSAYTKVKAVNTNAVLWLVGPDEEDINGQSKELINGLHDSIKWIGPTFTPECYMQAADVLLLPSYREGFGSVIIEAAACHLPTIAYRINGVIDAIVDGKTGILVETGNVSAFAKQMQRLLASPVLRESLGSFAQERAFANFSSKAVTTAWLNFYAKNLIH